MGVSGPPGVKSSWCPVLQVSSPPDVQSSRCTVLILSSPPGVQSCQCSVLPVSNPPGIQSSRCPVLLACSPQGVQSSRCPVLQVSRPPGGLLQEGSSWWAPPCPVLPVPVLSVLLVGSSRSPFLLVSSPPDVQSSRCPVLLVSSPPGVQSSYVESSRCPVLPDCVNVLPTLVESRYQAFLPAAPCAVEWALSDNDHQCSGTQHCTFSH